MMNRNDIYKGWKVLDRQSLAEYNADGIWLRHEKTGMEIFHVLNDDVENLFAFGFRTIPEDSTGVAHIMEHSVLNGSERYPLKDPFIVLNNQSIKTYLNALTYPDKTLYPASSFVEKDYFNLMSVYGDAVFFPLLRENIFKQEGHRMEIGEDGKLSMQGVVFNEMKGSYSSFEDYCDQMLLATLEGTSYTNDSGGDPACIPDLTYEKYRAFHRAYYNPSNCRLFLAGNIPTEKQIDFINERFVDPWLSKNKDFVSKEELRTRAENEGFRFEPGTPVDFDRPHELTMQGPKAGAESAEKNPTVTVCWRLGESTDIKLFLDVALIEEILLGHDGAPLMRALLESHVGEDIFPSSGVYADIKYMIFNAGLRGVPRHKAAEVEKLVFDVLEKIAAEGVDASSVEAALMSLEFSQKEVRRGSGPYSMVIMRRSYRSWMNGGTPFDDLYLRSTLENLKKAIAEDPEYIQKLVRKLFIDNNNRTLLTVIPDAAFDRKRNQEEELRLKKADTPQNRERIQKEQDELRAFQQQPDSPEALSCLPHLHKDELTLDIETIGTEASSHDGIPVFTHVQPVNGITYINVYLPVDLLEAEDYLYLPFFAGIFTNMGVGTDDWATFSERIAGVMGGYSASFHMETVTKTACEAAGIIGDLRKAGTERTRLLYEHNPLLGRAWFTINAKMLDEKVEEGIKLLFDNLSHVNFSDKGRLHDLLLEYKNEMAASIAPNGHLYASGRASCTSNRSKAIEEICNGLTQEIFIQKLFDMGDEALCAKCESLKNVILKSGIVINITAEEEAVRKARAAITPYLEGFNEPKMPLLLEDNDFYKLVRLDDAVWFNAHTQVGFAASSLKAHEFGEKEAVAEEVLARYLSNNTLWEKIRTIGGAYGGFATLNSSDGIFQLASYRDPSPAASLAVFRESLSELSEKLLSEDELEKTVIGLYSSFRQPRTPSAKGLTAFIRLLYGVTDSDRLARMTDLVSVTPEDVRKAARYLLTQIDDMKEAVIFNDGEKFYGKKMELPL